MIVGPLLMLGDFNTTKTVADTTSRPITSRMMVKMSRILNQGMADTCEGAKGYFLLGLERHLTLKPRYLTSNPCY